MNISSKTRVLEGVTGLIEHGKTTAIMGPSGSGKVAQFCEHADVNVDYIPNNSCRKSTIWR